MNEYAGFKVGDKVQVTERPSSRSIHGKCPKDLQYPFMGTIDRFEDGYGVNCEKIMSAVIGGYGFIIDRLISTKTIKKLPKYAVGDVVRRRGEVSVIVKKDQPGAPEIYLVDNAERTKSNWTLESDIEPFDGFRVGDTVWTLKRGKGRIVDTPVFFISDNRPFTVRFDGEKKDRLPKIEYLLPTESAYKKAVIDDAFKLSIDVDYASEYPKTGTGTVYQCPTPVGIISESIPCPKIFGVFNIGDKVMYKDNKCVVVQKVTLGHMQWGPTYSVKSDDCRWDKVKHDDLKPWEPKFKVGDEVNYNGGKYVVQTIYTNSPTRDYHIHGFPFSFNVKEYDLTPWVDVKPKFKVGDVVFYPSSYGVSKWTVDVAWNPKSGFKYGLKGFDKDDNLCNVAVDESEIRLWKETKITDSLSPIEVFDIMPKDFVERHKPEFIGKHVSGKDMFRVSTAIGSAIYLGEKGDDIQ